MKFDGHLLFPKSWKMLLKSGLYYWQYNILFVIDSTTYFSLLTVQHTFRYWQHNILFVIDSTTYFSLLTAQHTFRYW